MKKTFLVIIVLTIAAVSFFAGGRYGPGQPDSTGPQDEREVLYYVDPMTPGFRSDEPGIAPCGMPLEPVYAIDGQGQGGASVPLPPGAVVVNPARQQLIGVKTAPVEISPMTYTLRLYGQIVPDETLTYRINASTDSWIREVSDVTTGSIVSKGQILAMALAPSYYNAQVTFLIAMDNVDRIQQQLGGQTRQNQADIADNQIRVSVQALQNLGITDPQVEELANTRKAMPYLQVRSPTRGVVLARNLTLNQWFKAGEEFYTIADIGKVWVYADVYENEARHLAPGMKVKVKHKQMGKIFDATVSRVLPLFDQISKTLKVRLDIDNPVYDLRPDMFVDVEVPITMPKSLHVPADALIDSGTKAIVYVDIGNGAFLPRHVSTGWRLGRQVEITSGLMPEEKVVVAGNFLIDSESRMRTSASGQENVVSRDPVCGMYVDVEVAGSLGRTSVYANQTYYFCMDECKEGFEKEPGKYISDSPKQQSESGGQSQHMPGMEQSWLQALGSGHGAQMKKSEAMAHQKGSKADFGNALTSRGVVDWDGPEPREGRDWTGWGKFPGARYLGVQDETKTSAGHQGNTKSGNEVQEKPASDQVQEPAR